ncbi:MAG TPA: hypothetical protein VF692_03140, partial [Pyrinomonadaceae bacterium]
ARFLNLQTKLAALSGEQSTEVEKALDAFAESIGATEKSLGELKHSETHIAALVDSMENLQTATAHFTLSETPAENISNSIGESSLCAETAPEFEPFASV